jgi:alpha-beta hydrolase superfamily lysophospholipase
MAVETLGAIAAVNAALATIKLPVLIMHGTGDEIADPAGSRLIYDHVGSTDRTLKLYDGLWHQLFNEPERETVLADVTSWLRARS